MPKLAVAGTYQDEYEAAVASAEAARALADTTPARPEADHGWWKHDVVKRLTAAEPERLIVWIDDELRRPTRRGPARQGSFPLGQTRQTVWLRPTCSCSKRQSDWTSRSTHVANTVGA